jgi:hypothetical protein
MCFFFFLYESELYANYRGNIEFTAGSSESLTDLSNELNTVIPTPLTVLGGPTADIPTPSNETTSPLPAEASADSDTAGTSTMLEVTNVAISAAPVPPGKVIGKGKAVATIVGAGFTEK